MGADLPLVTVEADKIVPYENVGRVEGKELLKNFNNDLKTNVLLLAAYIHTQSIGEKNMNCLADKFAIAQVIINRLGYKYANCNNLRDYLLKHSTTIKKNLSRYFWIDPKEYYSQQCLIAAYQVFHGNIPPEFYVGMASRFQNNKKCKPLGTRRHIEVKKFVHTFYISKRFMKKIDKQNLNKSLGIKGLDLVSIENKKNYIIKKSKLNE